METTINRTLELIRRAGPISARSLSELLSISEKDARTQIDRLRSLGEPVWHDPDRGEFWWRNDRPPGKTPQLRWKRRYDEDGGAKQKGSIPFTLGGAYTRKLIAETVGLPPDRRSGADWMTGYAVWQDDLYIFCNVGVPGRTGHDYQNRWDGKQLIWFGKTNSHIEQPLFRRVIAGKLRVLIFWRGQDRSPFTFSGVGYPYAIENKSSPIEITWSFEQHDVATELLGKASTAPRGSRRGPPPRPGLRTHNIPAGPTDLYFMELVGPIDKMITGLEIASKIVKVGISQNPNRRVAELNWGFPPGSQIYWQLIHRRSFKTGLAAFAMETMWLDRLRLRKQLIGGEYAKLSSMDLHEIISDTEK